MNAHQFVRAKLRDTVAERHAPPVSFQKSTAQPPVHACVKLQHAIGNQAVNRIVQAKLSVNPPENEYERKVDDVAAANLKRISTPGTRAVQYQDLRGDEDSIAVLPGAQANVEQVIGGVQPQAGEPNQTLQRRVVRDGHETAYRTEDNVSKPNNTGLPDNLKTGIELLSGMSMDNVKVHYNSAQPAKLNALAYAKGSDIHLAPGQQQHLPHEVWHVVQQAQGRVQPTLRMKDGVSVNDDAGLEREADVMGERVDAGVEQASQHKSRYDPIPFSRFDPLPFSAFGGGVLQAVWAEKTYQIDNSQRKMYVEDHGVTWGGAPATPAARANRRGGPRAILFETMCRDTRVIELRDTLNQPRSLWDTGLTVVINHAYTPAQVYNKAGQMTNIDRTHGETEVQAKAAVTAAHLQTTNGWMGMPINAVKAVWERRQVTKDETNSELEIVQGSVPYALFRKLSAESQGATAIFDALRSNHAEAQVWRKMGDDDMPYVNPNPAPYFGKNTEVGKLAEVEKLGQMYVKPTFVTFGYNLVTTGTNQPITGILQMIYAKEMALRDRIAALGAPMYPSEPTTFYQPRVDGSMTAAWDIMEAQAVGGSGQQLEGAKLTQALNNSGLGLQHYTFHTIIVKTGAAERNDALIKLLNGWYNGGQGNQALFLPSRVEEAINGLDQCALKQDEYLGKVVGNLGGKLNATLHYQIDDLVKQYRTEAAKAACDALAASINPRYLEVWEKSALYLNKRYALGFKGQADSEVQSGDENKVANR